MLSWYLSSRRKTRSGQTKSISKKGFLEKIKNDVDIFGHIITGDENGSSNAAKNHRIIQTQDGANVNIKDKSHVDHIFFDHKILVH